MSEAADIAATLAKFNGGLCEACIVETADVAPEGVRRAIANLAVDLSVTLEHGRCIRCGKDGDLASLA